MISSPFQQKEPNAIPNSSQQKKPNAKPYPFQQKRAGTKPTLFNRESMQFSQRSSTTESDRFP